MHPDRAGGSTIAFARVAAAHDCLSDAEGCRRTFDRGAAIEDFRPSLAEAVERHYFPERFPFEPFGDPFEDHGEEGAARHRRGVRRQRERSGAAPPNATAAGPALEAVLQDEKDEV